MSLLDPAAPGFAASWLEGSPQKRTEVISVIKVQRCGHVRAGAGD